MMQVVGMLGFHHVIIVGIQLNYAKPYEMEPIGCTQSRKLVFKQLYTVFNSHIVTTRQMLIAS